MVGRNLSEKITRGPVGLSRDDTRDRLGVKNTRTIDRLIRDGKLKAFRVGSRVMVFTDSIDEYLKREVFDAGAAS